MRCFPWIALAAWLSAPVAQGGVIAYWQFESPDPTADSSGNNNTLGMVNVTTAADKATNAPGTKCAVFDGTAYAQTVGTLDLTTYTNLTIEWWMKTSQTSFGMVLEHSANYNYNPGAFISYYNESPGRMVFANLATGYAIRSVPLLNDGVWHHYAFTIDAGDVTAHRIELYVDGVLSAAATNSVVSGGKTFLNDIFNIGSRNGTGLFLNARIDEMRISDQILNPETFLLPVSYPDAMVAITQQPADLQLLQNRSGQFSVQATITIAPASTLAYRWQVQPPGGGAWTNIPGATHPTLSVASVTPSQDGQKYRVIVRGLASPSTVTSREATLNVIVDNTPPQVMAASSLNANSIGLRFSEGLDPISATNISYYTPQGASVTNATLLADAETVVLGVNTLAGSTFSLGVAGVKDLAGNPIVATNVTGPILVLTFQTVALDVAPPWEPGFAYSSVSNIVDVAAGGVDIWGSDDSFNYVYGTATGDFDVRVQVASLVGGSFYGKAGLMVRESLDASSRELSIVTYPTYGVFAPVIRATTAGPSDVWGPLANFGTGVAYPNVWVRLKRTGDTFASYGSANGVDWTKLSELTPSELYPAQVYLGLATTAAIDQPGVLIQAEYWNYGATPLIAPRILQQPQSASKLVGENYTLSVVLGGTDPFTFQWQKDGTNIAGATDSTLALTNLAVLDSGKYQVIVSNVVAAVQSQEATLDVAPPALQATKRTITDVEVFDAATKVLNNRGDQGLAIDGSTATGSYMTPGGTTVPQILAFDLGPTPQAVTRIRVAKSGNIDGIGGTDNMNLEVLYSTGTGPLNARQYQRVRGLASGFLGSEQVVAAAVNADGTVLKEHTDYATDGWYSLNFSQVEATAIALRVARDSGDPYNFVHYLTYEFEVYYDTPTRVSAPPFTGIKVFAAPRIETTRDDATNAIDGNIATSSYVTASGTVGPQIATFDLGNATHINRLRVAPIADVDGTGNPVDHLNLVILYSTNSGDLLSRSYQPVTNLTNGYQGTELAVADAVNADGTVTRIYHDYVNDGGYYSLTFDGVDATAIAVQFTRDLADDLPYTHFHVYEVEARNGDVKATISGLRAFSVGLTDSTRNDAALAIDGNINTFSYLTQSGTTGPQLAVFDFGALKTANHLRVAKIGDIDGLTGPWTMNLEIMYTFGIGDPTNRTYYPVSGLQNGYNGAELMKAVAVNPDGTIQKDTHDFAVDGWYSLTFDSVNATALAIQLAREPSDPYPYVHYPSFEIQGLYSPVVTATPPSLGITAGTGGLTISWPISAAGYGLYAAPTLPGSWTNVNQTVIQEGGTNKVTLPATGAAQFFRLQK